MEEDSSSHISKSFISSKYNPTSRKEQLIDECFMKWLIVRITVSKLYYVFTIPQVAKETEK